MPFKDAAARAHYMKNYWRNYLSAKDPEHGTKLDKVRARQAEWFQKNKAGLTEKKRLQRRAQATAEKVGAAIDILTAE